MSTTGKLKRVQARLSPKQTVLLDISRARTHGALDAHAKSICDSPYHPLTLADRIEKAASRDREGLSRTEHARRVRELQREGLFLAFLANQCNCYVVEQNREWRWAVAYFRSQFLHLVIAATHELDIGAATSSLRTGAESLLHDMLTARDAVRLIEREYFDGTQVTYPGGWSELQELIHEMDDVLSRTSDDGLEMPSAQPSQAKSRAPGTSDSVVRKEAIGLARLARAKTHDAMGETAEGYELVRSLIVGPAKVETAGGSHVGA